MSGLGETTDWFAEDLGDFASGAHPTPGELNIRLTSAAQNNEALETWAVQASGPVRSRLRVFRFICRVSKQYASICKTDAWHAKGLQDSSAAGKNEDAITKRYESPEH